MKPAVARSFGKGIAQGAAYALPQIMKVVGRIGKKKEDGSTDEQAVPVFGLQFDLHHPKAMIPSRGYPHDAGLDLSTPEGFTLNPHETRSVPTYVSIHGGLPPGVYGLVCGRSGWAKKGLLVNPGTIDPYYDGIIYVTLHNLNDYPLTIEPGNRIAQIVFKPFLYFDPIVYAGNHHADDANAPKRGKKGFGSTGD